MTEEAGDKKRLSKGCWKAALAVIGVYVAAAAFCIAATALSDKDSAESSVGEGIRFIVPPIRVSPPALEDPIEESLPTSTWPITPTSIPDSPTPPEDLGGWMLVEELDDGVRYESIDAGLSITLPGDWIVIDDEEELYAILGNDEGAEGAKMFLERGDLLAVYLIPEDRAAGGVPLGISRLPWPVMIDFEGQITRLVESTARTGDYDISVGPEFMSLPAGEAARVELTKTRSTSDGSEQTVTLCVYHLVVNETLITTMLTAPGTLIDTFRPVLAEIMESVEALEVDGQ
jgi:hypothetical protein